MKPSYTLLQVIPELDTGGAEVGCVDICKALAKQGHKPLIATHGGRLVEACRKHGIEIIEMPVHSKNPKQLILNSRYFRHLITQRKIDLIHVRSRAPAWSVALTMRNNPIPWLTTYHGAYGQANSFKRAYNQVMTKGDAIIAPSHFIAKHIQSYYPECADKISTIHRGIDLQQFTPGTSTRANLEQLAKRWQIQPKQKIILFPARMTRLKGHLVAIEALAQIKPWLLEQHIKTIFLGNRNNHSYCQEIMATINKLGLESLIHMDDHCNHIHDAYTLANLVLSCSVQPESFGRTIVEAQAMGALVIGTDHGGARETIIPGKTGWLVPPENSAVLASTIKKVLALESATTQTIISQARQHVENTFSLERMCNQTIKLYQKLIEETVIA